METHALGPVNPHALVPTRADLERALDRAVSAPDLLELDRKLAALRAYLTAHDADRDVLNDAAEVALRAKRRIGATLSTITFHPGGRPSKETGDRPLPVLADFNLTKRQSSDYQAAAAIPEPDFRAWVAETRAAGEDLTLAGLLRFGRQLKDDTPPSEFPNVTPDAETKYECPSCGYAWNGGPAPRRAA